MRFVLFDCAVSCKIRSELRAILMYVPNTNERKHGFDETNIFARRAQVGFEFRERTWHIDLF